MVNGMNDCLAVAPGVVTGQQVPAQPAGDKGLCGPKHLGFGSAKAVNALLGIAHNENTGRFASAAVATEPGIKRLPLQGVGVLKLVNHQVPNAGIQALLHPS